jgi:acyl dehydratase
MPDDEALQNAYKVMTERIGKPLPASDWFQVQQSQINQFADVTMDHQWIHVEVERAKAGPFGAPIAHGHLTLSILGHLPRSTPEQPEGERLPGQKMGINYGFDRVRFPSPVKAGARVRTQRTLKRVEVKGDMLETMYEVVMEIEGEAKPACVAESLGRMVF